MAYRDLRDFLATLATLGELHRVAAEVSPELELAAITDRICKEPGGGPALLFERVAGSDWPVATNLFGSPSRLAAALGVESLAELTPWLAARLAGLPGDTSLARLAALAASADWQAAGPVIDPHPPCQEVAETELTRWPLLKSWPNDGLPDHGGRFLTLPLVITRDPVTGEQNCGMYRAALLGSDRLVIHWGEESGAAAHARAWAARGEAMPVAIALGGDPAVTFAATLPLPASLDEFTFAGLLRSEPVSLARCRSVDLLVPAGAELVIEGTVQPGEKAGSGAFGNHTGSSVPGVAMPVLRVTTITRRQQPIYPATVVGPPPMEDCWLARAAERLLLPLLQLDLPLVREIHQPLAGIFHGATLVAVTTASSGKGREILADLWATPWLARSRLLVLVDAEQDPAEVAGVYWRVLNHCDWSRDLVVRDGRLGIDASRKPSGAAGSAPQREPLQMTAEIVRLVERRWREYGF